MDPSNIIRMISAVEQIPYSIESPDGLKYDIPFMKRQESLINNRFQSDVTFLVGEKRQPIFAHKLLLIIASEYFNAMFNGNFKESSSDEIEVRDIEADIFLEILRFIYCGKVRLTIENVLEIYVHAQKYMLNELRRRTVRFLENHIDADNALKIFAQNRLYEFSFINEKCLALITKNPLIYLHHEDFYVLDRKSLEIIFASKKINCSDDQLFQALRDWKRMNEHESVNELQSVIKAKRSYNCSKLRFFGNMSMTEGTETYLKFSIDHTHSLAFYGIGVFVKSPDSVVTIEVEIAENLEILGQYQFEYENKDQLAVNVANLFFEELTLRPGEWYTVSATFIPESSCFCITNPQICHDKLKLFYDNNYQTIRSVVSHFYCDEIKK
ncbi:BTB/POZ domain-containing protein 6-A-like isoform X3 [Topomyia yanbarensis]|uniref:BTB/POZ domain-containing protein 6-A-like isoform X3 n=1 Tax=Topomyia yanbarensis TaxID=2498891 RepID=UPI00273B444C|nr:BTB/POZ domain-containing protein 6-A-like isoform X3 [Topomyia yanbarensis]